MSGTVVLSICGSCLAYALSASSIYVDSDATLEAASTAAAANPEQVPPFQP